MRRGIEKLFGLMSKKSDHLIVARELRNAMPLHRCLRIERLENRLTMCSDLSQEFNGDVSFASWGNTEIEAAAIESLAASLTATQDSAIAEVGANSQLESPPIVDEALQQLLMEAEGEDENEAPRAIFVMCQFGEDRYWDVIGRVEDDSALDSISVVLTGFIEATDLAVQEDGSFFMHSILEIFNSGSVTATATDSSGAVSEAITTICGL